MVCFCDETGVFHFHTIRSFYPDLRIKLYFHFIPRFGVETFVVGIGDHVDPNELRIIATDRNHVFQVRHFDDLVSIHEEVVKSICASKFLYSIT